MRITLATLHKHFVATIRPPLGPFWPTLVALVRPLLAVILGMPVLTLGVKLTVNRLKGSRQLVNPGCPRTVARTRHVVRTLVP